jgi:hypothetical protein
MSQLNFLLLHMEHRREYCLAILLHCKHSLWASEGRQQALLYLLWRLRRWRSALWLAWWSATWWDLHIARDERRPSYIAELLGIFAGETRSLECTLILFFWLEKHPPGVNALALHTGRQMWSGIKACAPSLSATAGSLLNCGPCTSQRYRAGRQLVLYRLV